MNKETPCCPICKSSDQEALFPSFEGTCITSDMKILEEVKISNSICRNCGLIFNSQGTRDITADFYEKSYSLMMASKDAAIKNFSGNKPVTQAELTYNVLIDMVGPGPTGKLLEAGAGKGDFLTHFVKEYDDWQVSAFESSEAFPTLCENIPNASLARCQYEEYEAEEESFDIIVALGVLEHVKDPLHMLKWASGLLKDGGVFYIRVPNFAKNPNDLFCVDHLSKLTPHSLSSIATAAGYETIDVLEKGVPVFTAMKKVGREAELVSTYRENSIIADQNVAISKNSMDSIVHGQKVAESRGENFAVFGLGSVGLFAPFFGGFSPDKIAVYLDENESVWGRKVHGRSVGGLELIEKYSIRHVALSISPVYYSVVKEKLEKHDVTVYGG